VAPFPCPCCGFLTLPEEPPGTFFICPVCGWEDDNVQFDDVNMQGGANRVSLKQAQANYRRFAKSDPDGRSAVRPPLPHER
jgi:Cysteine-rich CPCC